MKRVLIDYKRLPREIAALLITNYPDGYGDDDIIAFKSPKGEYIEAVELRTEDTLYLVKISQSLSHFIANFEETIEKELEARSAAQQDRMEEEIPEMQMNDSEALDQDLD